MERIFENTNKNEKTGLLHLAIENIMANLPILVCGFGVAIALGWDALA